MQKEQTSIYQAGEKRRTTRELNLKASSNWQADSLKTCIWTSKSLWRTDRVCRIDSLRTIMQSPQKCSNKIYPRLTPRFNFQLWNKNSISHRWQINSLVRVDCPKFRTSFSSVPTQPRTAPSSKQPWRHFPILCSWKIKETWSQISNY